MRNTVIFSLTIGLAACGEQTASNPQAAPAVDVRALILADNPMACAADEAIRTAIAAGDNRYGDALAKGMPAIRTDTVSATDIKKEIHEITCSAMTHSRSPYVDGEQSTSLAYKLRPALDKDSNYVAAVFDSAAVQTMVSSQIAWWEKQQQAMQLTPEQDDTIHNSNAAADQVLTEKVAGTDEVANKDICRASVVREVASIEDPSSTMKAGESYDDVTQFWKNKSTGDTHYCQHGGYCYPSHVVVNGQKVEAIKLLNCSVKDDGEDDGTDIMYSVY